MRFYEDSIVPRWGDHKHGPYHEYFDLVVGWQGTRDCSERDGQGLCPRDHVLEGLAPDIRKVDGHGIVGVEMEGRAS